MWIYCQSTGGIYHDNLRAPLAYGYSGKGIAKNRPECQNLHNEGPIPVGVYQMQEPVNTMEHGPYVIWLTPGSANEMEGRSDFGIHGDSFTHPGAASEGCIIAPRFLRERMWESEDHLLTVVANFGDPVPEVPVEWQ